MNYLAKLTKLFYIIDYFSDRQIFFRETLRDFLEIFEPRNVRISSGICFSDRFSLKEREKQS